MDEDRIKGTATDLGGKLKEAVGGLVGDSRTQVGGRVDQASGQLQHAYGSAKDTMRDTASTIGSDVEEFVRDRPILALLSAVGVGYVLARLVAQR